MGGLVIKRPQRNQSYWSLYVQNRIKNMKNFIGFFSGPTGSGKSWASISFCSEVDSTFGPERIVTSAEQLMELINKGNLPTGAAILWEEAGVGVGSRDWQSVANKMINFLLQTFRHKRFILILNAPYLDFVDASTRKLFHAEFQTISINKKTNMCKIKPMLIQYNSRKKKFYYKYLRVRTEKRVAPLKIWNIPKPPEWMIEEYDKIKTKFTKDLNAEIQNTLRGLNAKQKDARKPITDKQEEVLKHIAKYQTDYTKISELLGITMRTIQFHKSQAEKKGYSVEEYRE